MNTKLLTIFTRKPLHVGAGSSVGAVDQPVVRERHTGYPVIPGSAIKGVLADLWLKKNEDGSTFFLEKEIGGRKVYESVRDKDGVELLGAENGDAKAGSLLIGEGKLLAFPVRSAKGCWAWLTCPLALKRFARDCGLAMDGGSGAPAPQPKDGSVSLFAPEPPNDEVYAPKKLEVGGSVVFEEYPLKIKGVVSEQTIRALAGLSDDEVWKTLADHLAIVSDELFAYFAQNACEIANHNRIDDKTGVVVQGALFSQENVPSETMFYSVLNTQKASDFEKLEAKLANEKGLLQIGADMTTGLGWCSVATKEVK